MKNVDFRFESLLDATLNGKSTHLIFSWLNKKWQNNNIYHIWKHLRENKKTSLKIKIICFLN